MTFKGTCEAFSSTEALPDATRAPQCRGRAPAFCQHLRWSRTTSAHRPRLHCSLRDKNMSLRPPIGRKQSGSGGMSEEMSPHPELRRPEDKTKAVKWRAATAGRKRSPRLLLWPRPLRSCLATPQSTLAPAPLLYAGFGQRGGRDFRNGSSSSEVTSQCQHARWRRITGRTRRGGGKCRWVRGCGEQRGFGAAWIRVGRPQGDGGALEGGDGCWGRVSALLREGGGVRLRGPTEGLKRSGFLSSGDAELSHPAGSGQPFQREVRRPVRLWQ